MRPGTLAVALVLVAAPSASGQAYEIWHLDGANHNSVFTTNGQIAVFDDRDGDGMADLLVGSPGGGNGHGAISLHSGATGALLWTVDGGTRDVGIGYTLAVLGDLDGDGVRDFATIDVADRINVFSGASQAVLYTNTVGSNYAPLSALVDADTDGVPDFAWGEPEYSGLETRQGSVRVRSGATFGLITTIEGEAAEQQFGQSLHAVGDVDADGVPDFMVGARQSFKGSEHGKIWVYSGATLGLIWRRTGNPGDALGMRLSPAGDVDADGYADVAVSAPWFNNLEGKVVVYSGFHGTSLHESTGGANDWFGYALGPAGDVLGDGSGDTKLLAANLAQNLGGAGRVALLDAVTGAVLAQIVGNAGEGLGSAIAGLGDVDGDGLADVAATLPYFDRQSDGSIRGRLAVYGWRLTPRVESVTPARGRYDSTTSVTIHGAWFAHATSIAVDFGGSAAANVQVVDSRTLTCDAPPGPPGPADVVVTTDLGASVAVPAFSWTPDLQIEGDLRPGGSGVIHHLVDPHDSILAIAGTPAAVDLPIPPFDGSLCILPFVVLTIVTDHPINVFDLPFDVPDDTSLSGADFLLQALVGPQLGGRGKSGSWTRCATLHLD